MLMKAFILALLVAGTAVAEAPMPGSYRGLVGRTATALDNAELYRNNKEVEMELRIDGAGRIWGSYFYLRVRGAGRGADITIEGRVTAGGEVRLEEKAESRVTGRWQGSYNGLAFAGTWTDPAGKRKLRFYLERLPDDKEKEREVDSRVAYRPRRVPGTDLTIPFLTRHPRPEVMKKVNDQIATAFSGHRCDPAELPDPTQDGYGVSWEVGYASPDLLSVWVGEERFCGGPYPESADMSYTYDLETGEAITFKGLFQNFEKDRDAILGALFAGASAEMTEECRKAAASWPTQEGGPGEKPTKGIVFLGDAIGFHLTPTALHVYEVGLPHVIAACALRAELPYEKLGRFVAPGSPIARILATKKPHR